MSHISSESVWLVTGVVLTTPPAILFPIFYSTTTPWYRSTIGRAVMIESAGMMLLVLIGVVRLLLGDNNPVFLGMRVGLYLLLPWGLWYIFYAYIKTVRAARILAGAKVPVPEDLKIENINSKDS